MKNLFIHIGLPKTGSSVLQVFLAKNAQKLLSHSYDYFRIGQFDAGYNGLIASGNGSQLSRCLLPNEHPSYLGSAYSVDNRRSFLTHLRMNEVANGILSSELFVEADKEKMISLIDEIKALGISVKFIYFIRSQDQILSSMYIQQVKRHGCTAQPDVHIMNNYKRHSFLRYNSYYTYLCSLVGKENIHVNLYEKTIKEENIFRVFLRNLGIDDNSFTFDIAEVNTSLSSKELIIMLQLNRFLPRMNFSDLVVENSIVAGLSRSGTRHNFLKPEQIEIIKAFFNEENSLISKRLFEGIDIFSPSAVGELFCFKPEMIEISDLISFFGGLLVGYDKRISKLENGHSGMNQTLEFSSKKSL